MKNSLRAINRAILAASTLASIQRGEDVISPEAIRAYEQVTEELMVAMGKFFETVQKITEEEAERQIPNGRELLRQHVQERIENDPDIN